MCFIIFLNISKVNPFSDLIVSTLNDVTDHSISIALARRFSNPSLDLNLKLHKMNDKVGKMKEWNEFFRNRVYSLDLPPCFYLYYFVVF